MGSIGVITRSFPSGRLQSWRLDLRELVRLTRNDLAFREEPRPLIWW